MAMGIKLDRPRLYTGIDQFKRDGDGMIDQHLLGRW